MENSTPSFSKEEIEAVEIVAVVPLESNELTVEQESKLFQKSLDKRKDILSKWVNKAKDDEHYHITLIQGDAIGNLIKSVLNSSMSSDEETLVKSIFQMTLFEVGKKQFLF
eukprot:TRINITY_DN5046_c0_g1_i4.p1 TRINITY_DN5046_c0_g1~~TRINITY_DN5046_c0_g1_i4.p1  ORF type:complete len:111 (+),score=20.03 TRINITY_DN5046_c0_g1_i4:386-718(+)